jgi:exodeoxyribonuclease III
MKKLLLVSWNVNCIRACLKKGFMEWLLACKPDVLCLQETRVDDTKIPRELCELADYDSYWFCAKQRGYASVATIVKKSLNAASIQKGIELDEFDREGRSLTIQVNDYAIVNCYFPNSQHDHARLDYKLKFNNEILKFLDRLKKNGKKVILCGDFNVAHEEIDLKNPKSNVDNPGFLPEEREWMTHFLSSGYIDTFRYFYPDLPDQYTWWTYRGGARKKNVGWRIDYYCINDEAKESLISSGILNKVTGSDHCPVFIEVKFP